ncbi:hypothetical protein [Kitasatospora sp. NPDC085464]|uniref:hypothetical protein n=1 Tax=Kitasatospora sp. NPDC085464 TaxID=3364063 RepID=UPI0037CBDAA3
MIKRRTAVLILLTVAASVWLGANTSYYDAPGNAGIAIGPSESCQIGYEWRGTPGLFAYC